MCLQTYKSHERSREAIEFAYEAILKQDMKRRQKYGFKPPKLGRKTDLDADVVSIGEPIPLCQGIFTFVTVPE